VGDYNEQDRWEEVSVRNHFPALRCER
jgi:hypothetical protein